MFHSNPWKYTHMRIWQFEHKQKQCYMNKMQVKLYYEKISIKEQLSKGPTRYRTTQKGGLLRSQRSSFNGFCCACGLSLTFNDYFQSYSIREYRWLSFYYLSKRQFKGLYSFYSVVFGPTSYLTLIQQRRTTGYLLPIQLQYHSNNAVVSWYW